MSDDEYRWDLGGFWSRPAWVAPDGEGARRRQDQLDRIEQLLEQSAPVQVEPGPTPEGLGQERVAPLLERED